MRNISSFFLTILITIACFSGQKVSGKWLDPPVVFINHGINKEFNYWTDVIENVAPQPMKAAEIENYNEKVPGGQRKWSEDAKTAREYHSLITKTGWKDYGNVIFRTE